MNKIKVILSIFIILVIITGGGFYWKWYTLHHAEVVIEPDVWAIAEQQNKKNQPSEANSQVNILILGTDNRGDEVARSDTIMFVTANVDTHKVSIISIPRDTRVDIPGVGLTKINHANAVGEMRGGVHEGTLESTRAVSNFLGVPINYYIKIDFQGFAKAIDAVGGIDVTLPYPVNDNRIQLAAGTHHLNGDQALRFSRVRYGLPNGDFDRQRDQFMLLSVLAQRMLSLSNIAKLPEVINIVYNELMDTNMSAAKIAAMGLEFKGIAKEDIQYYQLPGRGISAQDPLVGAPVYYFEPDLDGVKAVVKQAIKPD